MSEPALLIGSATSEVSALAAALPGELTVVPDVSLSNQSWSWADRLERWRG